MKNYFTAIIFILIVSFTNSDLKAQGDNKKEKPEEDKHKIVIAANAGQSLIGFLFEKLRTTANQHEAGIDLSQTPALQISGDYYVDPKFSVGAAVSYQQFNINLNHWKYLDEITSQYTIVDFSTKVTRTQIGARALFHFYNKKKLDMFSGLRFGPTIWKATTNSPDPKYEALGSLQGGAFAVQLIVFGLRGYLTDNIGLDFELAVGSPYYASAGINCRF